MLTCKKKTKHEKSASTNVCIWLGKIMKVQTPSKKKDMSINIMGCIVEKGLKDEIPTLTNQQNWLGKQKQSH